MHHDGEQAWIWMFRTAKYTTFAVQELIGTAVPEEVSGEDFYGTIVCDGWTAYPAFSDYLHGCREHLLREAEEVASVYEEAEPIYRHLMQMFAGLEACLETDPTPRERMRTHQMAQRGLESIFDCSDSDGPLSTLLG